LKSSRALVHKRRKVSWIRRKVHWNPQEIHMEKVMRTSKMTPRQDQKKVNPFPISILTILDIGTDHVDDTGEGMEGVRDLESGQRKGYAELKTEILGMLDTLQTHIEENI
jgi:hypothetical protein